MRRLLLMIPAAALLGSCEPTTYGQAIQQQKRVEAARAGDTEALPSCPTIAREGSADYERCERMLDDGQRGVGGSGAADPDVRYWQDADPGAAGHIRNNNPD